MAKMTLASGRPVGLAITAQDGAAGQEKRQVVAVDRVIAAAERRRTFHTLDALRGVAAIAVVAYHYPELLAPFRVEGAYLAVDLFFLMSGVVIAHAYRARFDAGLGAGAFLLARIARLYPLFAIGVLVSIGSIAGALAAGQPSRWTWSALAAALPNLVFLPSPPVAGRSPELYPLDFPAWSLFYELVVNAALAAAWRRLRGAGIVAPVAAAAPLLVVAAIRAGALDGGIYYADAATALARVCFSFFLGVAMLRGAGRLPAVRLPVPIVLVAATALLVVPVPAAGRAAYDLFCVLLAFPLLVWTAIHSEPRRGIGWCAWLGLVSFPLYMLHIPAKLLVIAASRTLLGANPSLFAPWTGIAALLGLLAASWLAARHLDPPLRRLTARALRQQPTIARQGVAGFGQQTGRR